MAVLGCPDPAADRSGGVRHGSQVARSPGTGLPINPSAQPGLCGRQDPSPAEPTMVPVSVTGAMEAPRRGPSPGLQHAPGRMCKTWLDEGVGWGYPLAVKDSKNR